MRALNRTRNVLLVSDGRIAATPWSRLRGLLGHAPLEPGEGLLLRGEKAIHTIGMSFPIDVLFLDRGGQIIHLDHCMLPQRASPIVWQASDVLELPAGTLASTGTELGDMVEVSK